MLLCPRANAVACQNQESRRVDACVFLTAVGSAQRHQNC